MLHQVSASTAGTPWNVAFDGCVSFRDACTHLLLSRPEVGGLCFLAPWVVPRDFSNWKILRGGFCFFFFFFSLHECCFPKFSPMIVKAGLSGLFRLHMPQFLSDLISCEDGEREHSVCLIQFCLFLVFYIDIYVIFLVEYFKLSPIITQTLGVEHISDILTNCINAAKSSQNNCFGMRFIRPSGSLLQYFDRRSHFEEKKCK